MTDCPNCEGFSEEINVVVESAMLTLCEKTSEVLPLKFPSLPYTAVMALLLPAASADVVRVATPEPLSVPVPMVVALSMKVTVPVGVPVAGDFATTVAVNVTGCPYVEELGAALTVVVESARFTVKVKLCVASDPTPFAALKLMG